MFAILPDGHRYTWPETGIPFQAFFTPARRRLAQVPDYGITFAGRRFQYAPIEDGGVAAAAIDQIALLQPLLRRRGNADPPRSRHVPEEFLRHAGSIKFNPVGGRQPPARAGAAEPRESDCMRRSVKCWRVVIV